MPGIMRPRRELVDQHLAVMGDEHLDREQPDEIELFRDVAGDRFGAHRDLGLDPRRRDGRVEDVIDVLVLDRGIGCGLAVLAARDDDRDFAGEFDEPSRMLSVEPKPRQIAARSLSLRMPTWPLPS